VSNITDFYDVSKKGTLIVSTYRSGTHFLYDNLVHHLRENRIRLRPLNEVDDLAFLQVPDHSYTVAILNSVGPKISLVKEQSLLDEWHVVNLTRNNKQAHWVSYYIWRYFNTEQQQFDDSNLPHHGGTRDKYAHIKPAVIDTSVIEQWLLEQYLVHLFKGSMMIDYEDLHSVTGTEFKWNPNDYGLIAEDLFVNHLEVKNLLQKYNL
jgi:hypothetical protein